MEDYNVEIGRVLAEVLRLQRWAGGESVSAARIFGLMRGFETVLRAERECKGIDEATQDAVEDVLQEIDESEAALDGHSLKHIFYQLKIDETVAEDVMRLCQLQSRFNDAIKRIAEAPGSPFSTLARGERPPELNWFGSLHYMELVDCDRRKLHSVFAPAVPRIGEYVRPEAGSLMRVVDVEYQVTKMDDGHRILVPFVYLEEQEDNNEIEAGEDGENDDEETNDEAEPRE